MAQKFFMASPPQVIKASANPWLVLVFLNRFLV